MRWPWHRKQPERRAIGGWDALVPYPTSAGTVVTPTRVEGIASALACVTLISETVASLPLKTYRRREDGGREEVSDHPLARVLRKPNRMQTGFEFREWLTASTLIHGNGYARIVLDARGAVAELVPLLATEVTPIRLASGAVAYDWSSGTKRERLLADEVLHLKWRSRDGIVGLSPVRLASETFGTALAEQEFQGASWRNGARPSAVLEHPGALNEQAKAALKQSFSEKFGGPSNAGKVLVLEEGMSLKAWSLTLKDADFIAARKLTAEDVARIYNVPPPCIGILDNATYSNISEQMKSLVRLTLRPWLERVEQVIADKCLSEAGRRTHYAEHSVEGLLRADTKDRYEAYRIAREYGWLSVNDIRRLENLPPVDGGETYMQPLNMGPLGGGTDEA